MRVPPSRRAQHALDAMAHIGKFMGDLTYDEFKNDELVLSAVKLKLLAVAEAVHRMPKAVQRDLMAPKERDDLQSLGNAIRHDYYEIGAGLVWRSAKNMMPVIKDRIDEATRHGLFDPPPPA